MGQSKAFAAVLILLTAWSAAASEQQESRMQAETFEGLELRGLGPALMAGRIADIAVHPHDQSTWSVAVGSGNVWKTVNAGTTWKPIFDDQGSYSIGCIALDPQRPEVVWVGTGDTPYPGWEELRGEGGGAGGRPDRARRGRVRGPPSHGSGAGRLPPGGLGPPLPVARRLRSIGSTPRRSRSRGTSRTCARLSRATSIRI